MLGSFLKKYLFLDVSTAVAVGRLTTAKVTTFVINVFEVISLLARTSKKPRGQ